MSYEQPADVVVDKAKGQSWNNQHGYVQTEASKCNREALKAAFEASGVKELRTWVKQQSLAGVAVPSYPTCMAWIKGKGESTGSTASQPSNANSRTALSLEQEFNRKFEAERQAAYIQFLKEEAASLRAKLAAVEHEITKLTSDPVVEG
ncbi:hypothetical protein ACSFE6_04845 [Pseudomonas baetica]|uniref:hypothetical protein n=1 Tax=Pseudomonas baetica TaxID=674054 RepID=UPI003EEB8DFE